MFNNKILKMLSGIALLFLIILIFSKLHYLHKVLAIIFKAFFVPLIIAVFFYYILKPLNNTFIKKGLTHGIAAALTLSIAIFIILGAFSIFGDYIVKEFNEVPKELNAILNKENPLNGIINKLARYINLTEVYKEFTNITKDYLQAIGSTFLLGIKFATNIFSKLFLILVILFYLLLDGYKFKASLLTLTPQKYRELISITLSESDGVLTSYVIGQSGVALSLAIMTFIGYKIIGIPNALLLSSITFILGFIPFIGFFISMIIPSLIAISMGLPMIIKLAVTFFIVQTLKGRVVVPAIMGTVMKIHPLTDIFLVIGAIAIGGPLAAFAAVPIYAVLKIFIVNLHKYNLTKRII